MSNFDQPRTSKHWSTIIFIGAYHLILALLLPIYLRNYQISGQLIGYSVFLYSLAMLSVTVGYHRLYSHKSYHAHPLVEGFLLLFGSMAIQRNALWWSYMHRLHHAHVDTDKDPYSIKKGFWYAHLLWMFEGKNEVDPKVVPDLMKNKLVMLQARFDVPLMWITNLLVVALGGWLFQDYFGAILIAGIARICATHHSVWSINSLAHTWGDRPFCQEQTAVNNFALAILTFGEGYHNYHHTFARDYRNGVRWFHFDPSKWMIWLLSKCGLVHGLKRMDWQTIQSRMVLSRKDVLLEHIANHLSNNRQVLEQKIQEASESLLKTIADLAKLMAEYRSLKLQCVDRSYLQKIGKEVKALRKGFQDEWKAWGQLSQTIHSLTQAPEGA